MVSPRVPMNFAGLNLSRIVAGCWRMADWAWTPEQRLYWIEACLALGITSFDLADIYGDYQVEKLFGEALALQPHLRKQMELVTKTGIALRSGTRPHHRVKHYNFQREHIAASVEQSLRHFGTDRIDLLLLHRPSPLMHPDEIAEVFYALEKSGKVRAFGVSNFMPSQFALLHARYPLVTNQVAFSPLFLPPLTDGTFDQALAEKTPPMIWSALGGGRLFGEDPVAQRISPVLQRMAKVQGVSAESVVYAWIMRHPACLLPITGSRRVEALRAAVDATAWQMDDQDWFEILEAARGQEVA